MAEADNAQDMFSGTKEVAESHKFDEANLAAWMEANVEGYEGPLTVKQFKGGQSNPTYKLFTPNKTYVMRRKPPGKLLPSAHAVDREFKVINALYPTGFPVARPYGLCMDEDVIGTIFYIMDNVDGRILWDQTLPDYEPAQRRAIYEAKVKTFADLHNTDYKKVGLQDFGKEGDYCARQIHRWTKQYKASETMHIPEMEQLIDWLPKNLPKNEDVTIVHGDYRLDNMVLHPTEPKVIAVLDWELSTLGDPLADFSYHLMNWVMPGNDESRGSIANIRDLEAHGIPTLEEYVDMYCQHTGRDGMPDLNYYFSYNAFRLAGILQGIVGRVRDGTASNANAASNAERVVPLARFAAERARMAGMEG
ncbi:phosphotransferase family protein [Henriciella sp.]|uniref:phosphotransferase family protein n=1 Tax=Henriciella sp. TaxID=1968823 RepID=UPI0017AA24DF|nr:phosphotransferase family protein [Henriciella sp.]HIG23014.1 phosphotransferase family protein [Henriciella sp.]